jgi:autotransporter-associated beta strand protein
MKKKFTLITLTLLLGLFSWNATAQTTFSWRNDQSPANNASWLSTSPYYFWNGTAGAVPGGSEILFFDGSAGTTMTNDLTATNRFKIIFGNTNTPAARTINGTTSNTFYDYGGTWPRIQNDAVGITHTLNFPMAASTTSGINFELVPMAGPLVFGGTINNNGRVIQIYGNNTAVDATNKWVRLSGIVSGAGALNVSQYGIVKLNAVNTYTGQTQIDNGELWVETGTNSATAAIASGSAIWVGNGGQMANVAKLFISNTSGGVNFVRNISINPGNSSTRFIGGLNTSGTNTFSGTITGPASATCDINLEQVTASAITNYTGIIKNGTSGTLNVVKVGLGISQLSAINTYTGSTTITEGELRLTPTANTSNLTQYILNGGTLSTTGIAAGRTITASTLQLNNSSTIALGSYIHSITFAASNGLTWVSGKTITITGWEPSSRLFVGNSSSGLTAGQLAQITFSGGNYTGAATITSAGEIVPSSYPSSSCVTVTGSASQDGNYSSLGAAITAIGTSQTGRTIDIAINASTVETNSAISIGAGDWSSLTIYPTAIATIQAVINTNTTPFISLTGANNVTIDGRLNKTGASSLTIINSYSGGTAGSTIAFTSNAQNNIVKYCTIAGNQSGAFGVISFSATATIANGNGLNVIDHNVITNNGAGPPRHGIYAIGNTSFPNIGNQITNNEFKNFLASYDNHITIVYIAGGVSAAQNDNFIISGNSFYQTATIDNYSTGNFSKTMIGIGASTAAFGGSHTITDNYFGGTAANCGGTALTKRYKEATLHVMAIYPSGGTTSIQNNTIKNISWSNDYYPTSMTGINIAGGTGDVNIGTITGNTIGDNTTTGSFVFIAKGTLDVSATMISISTTGAVNCQNNKIGSITAQHQTSARYINVTAIAKTASAGATTISNNIIGSLTTANSIYSYNTVLVAPTQNVTGISFSGSGTGTISNNTLANLANSTTTGTIYGIYLSGGSPTVNSNLIHSNVITNATTGVNCGIWCNSGTTNTITNNLIRLGDTNNSEIRGVGDAGTGTTNVYHNTVYIDGAPSTGTLINSACAFSSGTTNTRNYKNNILVNARSNNGATGTHYALNMTTQSSGTIDVNGNNYFVSGTGGKLGIYGSTESISSPQIVTGNDAGSVSVNPSFTNAGGTTVESYVPSSFAITGVNLLATVPADYNAVSRTTSPTMGAIDYRIWNGTEWNTTPTTDFNAKIDGTFSGAGFACRNLVVNAGKQLGITGGTLAVANNLTILSDAANGTGTITYSGLSVGGTTAVQQYLATTRNWYISSPVSAAIAPSGYTYYQRDEAGASWISQPFVSGNTFTVGKGYIALPSAAASTITFSGTLNNGNVTIPLTWSGASSKGFNLIGNPYPSHLTWTQTFAEAVTAPEGGTAPATLIEPSIYVRTNTGGTSNGTGVWSFETFNATTGLAVPNHSLLSGGIIPPMQAFWVRAKQAGNLILTNDLTKSHQSSNPLKAPAVKNTDRQLIRLQVSNGTRTDETLLLFDAKAENSFDRYDSPKFAEANTELQIYTSVGTEKLVMNGLESIPLNQEIALGFVPGSASAFSIKANEITNLPSDVRVILRDYANNGLETDLTEGVSGYNFNLAENNNDRFTLLFRAPGVSTGVENANKPNVQVYVNPANQIVIIAPEKSNYSIYNAVGQLVDNGIIVNHLPFTINHSNGMYVVKVGNQSIRVIVK